MNNDLLTNGSYFSTEQGENQVCPSYRHLSFLDTEENGGVNRSVSHREHSGDVCLTGHFLIWGFHGSAYEECRLLGHKNPGLTSQETHYVPATEPSPLMLCKIWGFHGGDNEECRLLGYKNAGLTSQETHYVSTTELSPLMLCKIWGFHGGDNEECRLLGYKTLFVLHRRHITSPLQSPAS
jgi:hypothetical protein